MVCWEDDEEPDRTQGDGGLRPIRGNVQEDRVAEGVGSPVKVGIWRKGNLRIGRQ